MLLLHSYIFSYPFIYITSILSIFLQKLNISYLSYKTMHAYNFPMNQKKFIRFNMITPLSLRYRKKCHVKTRRPHFCTDEPYSFYHIFDRPGQTIFYTLSGVFSVHRQPLLDKFQEGCRSGRVVICNPDFLETKNLP